VTSFEIHQILSGFIPISLDEIGTAKLMDRRDTKFVFPVSRLTEILGNLQSDYRVLEINQVRTPRYETVYYDTSDFFHFRQHHSKHLNRFKVRTRKYLETNCSFFEIKFKNNHGRTVKDRLEIDSPEDGLDERISAFIQHETNMDPGRLEQKLVVNYTRITLINKSQTERVTVDFGLHYSHDNKHHSYDPIVIAEVKRSSRSRSPFIRLMRDKKIREFSISKYCLGIMTLYDHVTHNRFKPKLRYLNKMIHASVGNP